MKAIVDKDGMLWHEQGKRKWPIECPYNESETVEQVLAVNDERRTMHYRRQCGDWCALWRELLKSREASDTEWWWQREDCRGNMHFYDAYEDQREGGEE